MPYFIILGVTVFALVVVLGVAVRRRKVVADKRTAKRKSSSTPAPLKTAEGAVEKSPTTEEEAPSQPTVPVPAGAATTVELHLVPDAATPEPAYSADPDVAKKSQLLARVLAEASAEDSGRIETFVIQAKVRLTREDRAHRMIREVSLAVRTDDGMDHPVITTNPAWQRSTSRRDFYFIGEAYRPGPEEKDSDWLEVLRVPANLLEMPRTGRSELRALVTWRGRRSKLVVARATGTCVFDVGSSGFLDILEEKDLPDWSVARVLGMILHLNGAPAPVAMQEVGLWLDARVASTLSNEASKQHRLNRLKQVIQDVGQLPPADREDAAKDSCRKLARLVRGFERVNLLEFFLRVAALTSPAYGPGSPLAEDLAHWMHARPGPASQIPPSHGAGSAQ